MTLLKVNEPEWKLLHRIADGLRPKLQQELFTALDSLKKQIPTASIVDLIEDGQLAQVLAAVKLDPPDLSALQDAIGQIVAQSGARAISNVEQLFPMRFDLVNPDAVNVIGSERWAQEYGRIEDRTHQLIQEVNRETQQAVSEIVQRGFLEGQAPRVQALAIEQVVGLHSRDAGAVSKYLSGLVADGMSERRAKELAGTYSNRLLRKRAEMIARTETMRASNLGQQIAWENATDLGLLLPGEVQKVWIVTDDDRTCARCMGLDDAQVDLDGSFTELPKEDRPVVAGQKPKTLKPKPKKSDFKPDNKAWLESLEESYFGQQVDRDQYDETTILSDRGEEVGRVKMALTYSDKRAVVQWINVEPQHRRKGVGTRLMEIVESKYGDTYKITTSGTTELGTAFFGKVRVRKSGQVTTLTPPLHPMCRCAMGLVEVEPVEEVFEPTPPEPPLDNARRYFADQGIEVDLPADYDQGTLDAVAEAHALLSKRFSGLLNRDLGAGPLGIRKIVVGTDLGPGQLARISAGSTMQLARKGFPSTETLRRSLKRGWNLAPDKLTVAIHEISHAIEYAAGGWDVRAGGAARVLDRFVRAGRKKAWGSEFYGPVYNDLSRYATENLDEFFAEAFAAHNSPSVTLGAEAQQRLQTFVDYVNNKTQQQFGFDVL